jgi:hypothetical protein
MPVSSRDVRSWIAGFEAADRVAADARRAEGPQRERSISRALSLLDAALQAHGGNYPVHPKRREDDRVARAAWSALKSRRPR